MKNMTRSLALVALTLISTFAFGQIQMPRPSPGATLTQDVGLSEITVDYSRPGVKDRTIFGELVPYGEVWRTGANMNTTIEFSDAVNFGGMDVPAGKYALLSVPGEKSWEIILNTKHEGNIGGYDEANDLGRITVEPKMLDMTIETFMIEFSHLTDDGAHLNLVWENTHVAIPITTDTDGKVMVMIEDQLMSGENADLKASDYHNAALFYQSNEMDMDQALEWMNKSVEMNPDAFWYIHRQAVLLKDMGKKKEAMAAAEKSLEMAKNNEEGDYGYIQRNEDLIAEIKDM